jgi:hypothetical protein
MLAVGLLPEGHFYARRHQGYGLDVVAAPPLVGQFNTNFGIWILVELKLAITSMSMVSETGRAVRNARRSGTASAGSNSRLENSNLSVISTQSRP